MGVSETISETAAFSVENVGGISEASVKFSPGVTVLTGENATNRTSFLQAIMAAMGSNQATLKANADQGSVELTLGGTEYERTLERAGNSVMFEGEGYLDDPTVAELFAFLHETNEARQAVARGDDLRDLIMRPIDIEEIREQIEQLTEEKASINDELATIESRKQELSDLEQRRSSLESQIDEKREELAEKETEIDESSNDLEESLAVKEELEQSFEELRSVRSDLESVRRNIESQRDSITSLEQERAELEDELAELPSAPMGEHEQLAEQIEQLRDRRQTLNAEINDLQSLITYNNDRLEEEDYEILQTLEDESPSESDGELTDQLLADAEESVVCWTCGSEVDRSQIQETIQRLEDLREQKVQTLNEVKSELETYKQRQREARRKQSRREEIERKFERIEDEIDQREDRVDSMKEQREELTEKVQTLEGTVEEYESADFDEILSLHREANQLEFEIDSLESDLEDVTEEIEEIESLFERAEELRDRREELLDELADTRTKVDQIEEEAVEAFNEHMDAILDILEYENLDRIWIERLEETAREGRETVKRTTFEMHVVRTTENGVAYEDTIEHLSESEREVTGLVFALAGYLVHDLYEEVPFMLLDSLEAIDSNRIARLVEYFAEFAPFLVVALLPEDAQALDDEYMRVTSI
ncbi:archaea-specific SMC-related protein [Halorhabdus amylolytica]|uniref:archaea-specific SMC-related protein n=1 Tax=Halorhabdus amylolytica TaxID=2559573 RepID=UPI0010AA0707|nr:archaea-specific SMC-related protein [Halorhabdus amylolytica]